MDTEALDEAKSPDGGSPVQEPEAMDRRDEAAAKAVGGEEGKEATCSEPRGYRMSSEAIDEAKSSDEGSPIKEPWSRNRGDEAEAEVVGGEESREAEVAGENKVEETRKRGGKRKTPGEAKEEGTEKKERKRRSVSREGATPVERPSRERKSVQRLVQLSPRIVSVSKVLSIEQGPGTKLKDIPNVFFKLSKRKTDENLQALHSILFGKKSNAYNLKRNIAQFSGFVWAGNEEKQRAKIKEKLDKCVKDKLLDFCVLLDIQTVRITSKKEEVTEKLLEFLESPHATSDVVLAEKQKGKRKRRTKGVSPAATGGPSSESETKKHKSSLEIEVKKGRKRSSKPKKEDEEESILAEKDDEDEHGTSEEQDVDDGGSTDNDGTPNAEKDNGDTEEESDHVKSEKEEEDEPEEPIAGKKGSDEKQKKVAGPRIKEKASPIKKGSPTKSGRGHLKPSLEKAFSDAEDVPSKRNSSKGQTSKRSKVSTKEKASPVNKGYVKAPKSRKSTVDDSDSSPPSSVKPKEENKRKVRSSDNPVKKVNTAGKKQSAKSVSKVSTKEQGKGKASGDATPRPSTEDLHSVVSNILKEVDFNTATLADILKQLGAHFNTDLMDRKSEVKRIIEDVINNMTDDEDGEEDGDDPEEGGEDAKDESDGDGE